MDRTFKDSFDLLCKIQSSKAPNTYAQCLQIVAHLSPWFQKNYPDLSSFETDFEEIWSEYVSSCRKTDKKRKLGHDRRYLVMALRRAQVKGWIKRSFSKTDFSLLESTETIGKYVESGDVKKLLDWLLSRSPRAWLQVQMAATMGMRKSEILRLRKEEIDLRRGEINLDPNRLKTRRARKVGIPITHAVRQALIDTCRETQSLYVFPMIRAGTCPIIDLARPQADNSYWWALARKATGVKCRFHDLRHTAISNALSRGMQPITASKIFGATQQVIAQVYDHIRPEDSELHRAILDGAK